MKARPSRVAKFVLVGLCVAVIFSVVAVIGLAWLDYATTSDTLRMDTASRRSQPQLALFLHRGVRGVRIVNETDATWERCQVEIAGDYGARFGPLTPRASKEIYYEDLEVSGRKLNADDGFGRAAISTTISCDGQTVRFAGER